MKYSDKFVKKFHQSDDKKTKVNKKLEKKDEHTAVSEQVVPHVADPIPVHSSLTFTVWHDGASTTITNSNNKYVVGAYYTTIPNSAAWLSWNPYYQVSKSNLADENKADYANWYKWYENRKPIINKYPKIEIGL